MSNHDVIISNYFKGLSASGNMSHKSRQHINLNANTLKIFADVWPNLNVNEIISCVRCRVYSSEVKLEIQVNKSSVLFYITDLTRSQVIKFGVLSDTNTRLTSKYIQFIS